MPSNMPNISLHIPDAERRIRRILFLGRIHPIKGLINLLEAWALVKPLDYKLTIAGPDEANYLQKILLKIQQLRLQGSVEVIGSVEGDAKHKLFCEATLLILPSFTENFGVVVTEALSYGIPVITTTGTPWSDLLDYGCGWWVAPTVEALTGALQEATSLAPQDLQAMGQKGREYVKRYDWNVIAEDTFAVYRWILNKGTKHNYVILE